MKMGVQKEKGRNKLVINILLIYEKHSYNQCNFENSNGYTLKLFSQDSENANELSSNCSFDGKNLFCGRQNVGVKQTLPTEFVVAFSISLINKNHRYVI